MSYLSQSSPVVPPETLGDIAQRMLALAKSDTMSVLIRHTAVGAARVSQGRVRLNESGDVLYIELVTQVGQRRAVYLQYDQLDPDTLRSVVAYLDRLARAQPGDASPVVMPIKPITYAPCAAWYDATAAAFTSARHTVIPSLVRPLLSVGITTTAFAGVFVRSKAYANKLGTVAMGQETDAELIVTGWTTDGRASGWAGQAERNWAQMHPDIIAENALRLTRMSANAVAFEPGRRTVILDRPAVVQLVREMGYHFSADATFAGRTALVDRNTGRLRIGERVIDERLTLSSDPHDPDGGYLSFNDDADPLVPMTWIERGVAKNMAFPRSSAAEYEVQPSNDPPQAMRLSVDASYATKTVDEMIASCEEGIYVNRFAYVGGVERDPTSGMLTGITNGGCFLVKKGKIDKPIRNLQFLDSPWFAFNRIVAIGAPKRAAFGYAPWAGEWPVPPVVAPPLMIRDFNFVAMADAI